ncbi:pentatricopeptide repeat-containing protein At5g27460-like [Neltuma alba]|uniref:pentatricopeptide repeat-containing protein At5g27460-like n=1 Tax=Neltuma alba TaxID=207710 RepID=UPI0010A397E8|nr:pentatricopeptide repeat-containing protein At5g27460-like [Prosopis alba]
MYGRSKLSIPFVLRNEVTGRNPKVCDGECRGSMAANRLFFAGLRSYNILFSPQSPWRPLATRGAAFDVELTQKDNLKKRILGLKPSDPIPTSVLQNWVDQGNNVSTSELRRISKILFSLKRYHHSLEIMTWMESQKNFRMSPADYGAKLELIIKIRGVVEAEKYFLRLPDISTQKATYLPILRGYVRDRDTNKAEVFMQKLYELGLVVSPLPYNEMMKLYVATNEYNKVPLVIQQMRRNKILFDVLSYNIWMNACHEGEGLGVTAAEMVFREMKNDQNVEVGWSSLATLANIYLKAGQSDKAILVLRNAEKKLSNCNRLGYFFLMTLYASLKEKEGVLRLWRASKLVGGRITCVNYICVLSCLVKLGNITEAENIFMEWESNCQNYDIRVSNVLLGAYMRNGMVGKAESLHAHALERGGRPNYKTWEILVEGYVKSKNMDKAVVTVKRALAMLKDCNWRPPHELLLAIAEYFEKHGNFEDANEYITDIRNSGLASLSLYKIWLRIHLAANKPPDHVLEMIEKDKVGMDNETLAIVKVCNK